MANIIFTVIASLSIGYVLPNSTSEELSPKQPHDPFQSTEGIERSAEAIKAKAAGEEHLSSRNHWGFSDSIVEWPEEEKTTLPREIEKAPTTTPYYEEIDSDRNGLLKDIGTINVGFGVGVGVPGNDPVRVASKVGVDFGASGLAGQLPIGQDIYPRQGEWKSLNDYDGNKANIVINRARKYWQAVQLGFIKLRQYRPASSLVRVGGDVGVG